MKRLTLSLMICLSAALTASAASFGFIEMRVDWDSPLTDIAGVSTRNNLASRAQGDFRNPDATAQLNGFDVLDGETNVSIWCLQLDEFSSGSWLEYKIVDLEDLEEVSPSEATELRQLVSKLGGIGEGGNTSDAEEQLAAWEITHEAPGTGLDINTSATASTGFRVTHTNGSGVSTGDINTLLTDLNLQSDNVDLFGLLHENRQDFGVLVVGEPETDIPEPATIVNMLGLTLLGGLFGYRRHRKRASS